MSMREDLVSCIKTLELNKIFYAKVQRNARNTIGVAALQSLRLCLKQNVD